MRKLLLAAALSLAAFAGCSKADKAADKTDQAADKAAANEEDSLPTMTVDEVEAAINAKQVQAVDTNPDTTRKKMGVVPGAVLVSDDSNYAASELPADKTMKLVFYCANPG